MQPIVERTTVNARHVNLLVAAVAALTLAAPAHADSLIAGGAPSASASELTTIPAPGGQVILPTRADKEGHDQYAYAAVRRVGDMVTLSGVIAGRLPGACRAKETTSRPSRPN